MIASFQKTTFKTGDIIIKWYSTRNTLQTQGSGLPLCKQNWPAYSAKDELLTLQTSSAYMSSVDFNLMTAFLGPVLSPLLFTIYTRKLFQIVERHLSQVHCYADDTQLHVSFSPNRSADFAIKSITDCISDIRSWMVSDNLMLNDDKTEFFNYRY